jgi:tetratricopeptide (TPR) repeat protein
MARLFPLIAALAVATAACGPPKPTYTKDRLPNDRMAEMVAAPLALAESGDLAGAQREFEAQLARSGPQEAPDLLTGFGVGLYLKGLEKDSEPLMRAALPYLERAIPAATARFGDGHPEMALALTTYADALRKLSPRDPPRRADEAYQRAYHIRARTLGPNNAETLYSLARLAQVRGLPSRTQGDPARIEKAADLFQAVIRGREANPDQPDYEPAENARFALIEMYVANGQLDKATAIARTSEAVTRPREVRCDIGPARVAVAAALREAGRNAEAAATLNPPERPPPECLFDPTFLRAGQ